MYEDIHIGDRAKGLFNNKWIVGKVIDKYYHRICIYPDNEIGSGESGDAVSFVFDTRVKKVVKL